MTTFTIRVPASTSNLGSGFDTASAALGLYLRVEVEVLEREGIHWVTPWDPAQENVLDRSLRAALDFCKGGPPGLQIVMHNPIPLKRGLGSSAAAIVAGIRIAEHVCGVQLSQDSRFDIAYPLEGHPDNLAASFLGGWVLSRVSQGKVYAEKVSSPLSCRFVLAIPELSVSTREARSILPETYKREHAVYNLQRCALLVHALHTGRRDLLREATRDRLHQPYRSRLVPGLTDVLEEKGLERDLAASLLGLSISGSGSAVIALADGRYEELGRWMVRTFEQAGTAAIWRVLDLDAQGPVITA